MTWDYSVIPQSEGATPFFTDATGGPDGGPCYRSGTIAHNGISRAVFSFSAAGALIVGYRVSSESGYDLLTIRTNTTTLVSVSGTESPWASLEVDLGAGQPIYIEYTKDSSDSAGDDCGWITLSFEPEPEPEPETEPTDPVSAFDLPLSQAPTAEPLRASFVRDEVEDELRALFLDLFARVANDTFDASVLGAPHLGTFALVQRWVNQDGLALVPPDHEESEAAMRYLYRAWISGDVQKRGLHFLRTYLQLLCPNRWQVDQLEQDPALPYPTDLQPATGAPDRLLTSRLLIQVQVSEENATLFEQALGLVLSSILPARFVPQFVLQFDPACIITWEGAPYQPLVPADGRWWYDGNYGGCDECQQGIVPLSCSIWADGFRPRSVALEITTPIYGHWRGYTADQPRTTDFQFRLGTSLGDFNYQVDMPAELREPGGVLEVTIPLPEGLGDITYLGLWLGYPVDPAHPDYPYGDNPAPGGPKDRPFVINAITFSPLPAC